MKTTLSLLAALALVACAGEKDATNTAPEAADNAKSTMEAPKAAKVSLNISGMT